MTMKKEQNVERLRSILVEAKIYNKKLDPQIELTSRLEHLIERVTKELDKSKTLTYTEITSSGTEKVVVNPLVVELERLESKLQDAYTSLGLTYNSKPQNISVSTAESSLDGFLSGFQKRE